MPAIMETVFTPWAGPAAATPAAAPVPRCVTCQIPVANAADAWPDGRGGVMCGGCREAIVSLPLAVPFFLPRA